MSDAFAKFVAKKILGETAKNHFGQEDPYFETVPATRLKGKRNKKGKKLPKATPPGISAHDAKVLTKVKRRAYRLDMGLFNFLGVQFGWGSVIGIVPAIGDVIDMLMALMVINTCETVEGGLDSSVLYKMYLNLILDFAIGLVPFLGDIADAMYKCNTRNAVLLEEFLRKRGQVALKRQGAHNIVDPSLPDTYDMEDDDEMPPPRRNTTRGHRDREPARPAPAKAPRETRGGGLFGLGGGRHHREPDIEMGDRDRDRTRRHR
ncbi:hypothetical protein GP486_003646 [Trichoglossum hirsutum]|uniref:PH domain-containing protein n=1 Tax=Trichoglossum hirsutum TaxID=265104 RepID=A0A9P8LCU8_9PEZI|nr:hypothetical protein GP486_003646 [Trichoglossum hirsutum]